MFHFHESFPSSMLKSNTVGWRKTYNIKICWRLPKSDYKKQILIFNLFIFWSMYLVYWVCTDFTLNIEIMVYIVWNHTHYFDYLLVLCKNEVFLARFVKLTICECYRFHKNCSLSSKKGIDFFLKNQYPCNHNVTME